MIRFLWYVVCLLLVAHTSNGQYKRELRNGWQCVRADKTPGTGYGMLRGVPIPGSMPAVVPGTVLTTMLHNKLIPDPMYGYNIAQIPDIYDTGRAFYTYWFVTDFKEHAMGNERVFLTLRGVNYACEIYVNGWTVNSEKAEGMYLRHRFDITQYVAKDGNNRLAILVRPPYVVGKPNGGQGGDGTIARNVTNQYVAGWDWIQPIPDRNTGIWDKVTVEKVYGVDITDVHVVTHVPGARIAADTNQAPAMVTVKVRLHNAEIKAVTGTLQYQLGGAMVNCPVTLQHGDSVVVLPVQTIRLPKLWWPNGMGPQHLYPLKVQFVYENGSYADVEQCYIGLRELTTRWNNTTQSREIWVNGQRMFVKGGNRILSDAMLRFSPQRYDAEVRYHRDMHLNMIRVWGGGITERPEFYEACDKYGLLVFQDLWVSGDCNGRWYDPLKADDTTTRRNYPDNHKLWLASAADQITMLRNHPSLAIWCGGNEIRPAADILKVLRDSLLPALDPGRCFFEYSNHDSMSLRAHDGPYTIQPDTFFWAHKSWGFNSEVGSVGMGDIESLKRFLPDSSLNIPRYDAASRKWVADPAWRFHKYYSYDSSVYAYGTPQSVKEFAAHAQLVNYNQYRALMEGTRAHMWNWYTGVLEWKTQNPWTAMVGQMYDVYLDPNACMNGMATGAKPLHVMYNPITKNIMVANDRHETVRTGLRITTFKTDGTTASDISVDSIYTIPPDTCIDLMHFAGTPVNGGFLKLGIAGSGNNNADENMYWMPDERGSYRWLQNLPPAAMQLHAYAWAPHKELIVLYIDMDPGSMAFFTRVSVVDKKTKKRVSPYFMSDNYFTIADGAGRKTVEIRYDADYAIPENRGEVLICIEGWNTGKRYIEIQSELPQELTK